MASATCNTRLYHEALPSSCVRILNVLALLIFHVIVALMLGASLAVIAMLLAFIKQRVIAFQSPPGIVSSLCK